MVLLDHRKVTSYMGRKTAKLEVPRSTFEVLDYAAPLVLV
jgi:hypothetical protein